jgi:hypothetical protein
VGTAHPTGTTLENYEFVIATVTSDRKANVYAHVYDRVIYPTLTAIVVDKLCLVMKRIDTPPSSIVFLAKAQSMPVQSITGDKPSLQAMLKSTVFDIQLAVRGESPFMDRS